MFPPSLKPAAIQSSHLSRNAGRNEHLLPGNETDSMSYIAPWTLHEPLVPFAKTKTRSSPSSSPKIKTSPTLSPIPELKEHMHSANPPSPETQQPETIRLLVGSQTNTTPYITRRLFEIPKTTLYKSCLYTYIIQQQSPKRHGADAKPIPSSLIRLEYLDPDAFELYIDYICTGTFVYPKGNSSSNPPPPANLSEIFRSTHDLSWAAAWPLLNAHVLATTIGDSSFATIVMQLLRRKIDRKEKVDIETIQHSFRVGATGEEARPAYNELKMFLVDEAIRGGMKNFEARRMGLYPMEFIHLALQRTVSRLEITSVRHNERAASRKDVKRKDKDEARKEKHKANEKVNNEVESCEAVSRYMRWEAMRRTKEMSTLRVKLVDSARSRVTGDLRRNLMSHVVWERDFAYEKAQTEEFRGTDSHNMNDQGISFAYTERHTESNRTSSPQHEVRETSTDEMLSANVEDNKRGDDSRMEGQSDGFFRATENQAEPPRTVRDSPEEDSESQTNITLQKEENLGTEKENAADKPEPLSTETKHASVASSLVTKEDEMNEFHGPHSATDNGSKIRLSKKAPNDFQDDVATRGTSDGC